MRILNINKYHYQRGGSDTVYFNTAKLLEKNGHSVNYFAMEYPENHETPDKIYFAPNNDYTVQSFIKKLQNFKSFFYNRQAKENLEELIIKQKPDVAHLHIFYGSLTSSILEVLKKNNIPVVATIHDYKIPCPAYLFLDGKNEICEKCRGSEYYNCVLNKCVKDSTLFSLAFALESYYRDYFFPLQSYIDKFIFVSKFSKEIHLKYKPELASKSIHLYNFDPNVSQKIPSYKSENYYLYAGRLSKEKGVNTLVEAFKKRPNLKLKIVGTGPVIDQLVNLPDNIEVLGFKTGKDLEDLISNSKYVIVPSEWYENNPMAIIESYSLGKPVIASKIAGIPEIVEDGSTGFLFTPKNIPDLLQILDKVESIPYDEYLTYCQNARRFSEINFNPNNHYFKLLEIYTSVLQK